MDCAVHFFFYKKKTSYEKRIRDWSSDVCSSVLVLAICAEVTAASDGAFDIGVGEAVTAWGFGPAQGQADQSAIRAALGHKLCAEEIGRAACRQRVCQ